MYYQLVHSPIEKVKTYSVLIQVYVIITSKW